MKKKYIILTVLCLLCFTSCQTDHAVVPSEPAGTYSTLWSDVKENQVRKQIKTATEQGVKAAKSNLWVIDNDMEGLTHEEQKDKENKNYLKYYDDLVAVGSVEPYDTLITNNLDLIGKRGVVNKCMLFYYRNQSEDTPQIGFMVNQFGHPECVRFTGPDTIYTIMETDNGTLCYDFYLRKHNSDTPDYFVWEWVSGFLMQKTLFLEDFSALKAGDSITEVEKIDPATQYINLNHYVDVAFEMAPALQDPESEIPFWKEKGFTIHSNHLLKNGLLFITYIMNEKGEFEISDINRVNSYTYKLSYDREESDDNTYDFTILPEDFINE